MKSGQVAKDQLTLDAAFRNAPKRQCTALQAPSTVTPEPPSAVSATYGAASAPSSSAGDDTSSLCPADVLPNPVNWTDVGSFYDASIDSWKQGSDPRTLPSRDTTPY